MSNIYISEPPTNGKVVVSTSVGEIELELWSKEAPKACRNFVQLCLEGYYDKTIFHRVVPDFIVQGGDPSGTGDGGESVYGQPFKTEVHSRLRFNRRGLVAMACTEPNSNQSQFFFTLGATPELDKKYTIFAKVVGKTIYNMIKLGECELDNNRPVHPDSVLKTEVVINPYSDIVPRKKEVKVVVEDKKEKPKASKNFSLLSFGDEAEEDEEETNVIVQKLRGKGKSAHDLLNDPRMLSTPVSISPLREDVDPKSQSPSSDEDNEKMENDKASTLAKIRGKLAAKEKSTLSTEGEKHVHSKSKLDLIREETESIKRDMIKENRRRMAKENASTTEDDNTSNLPKIKSSSNEILNSFHNDQQLYRERCAAKITSSDHDELSTVKSVVDKDDMQPVKKSKSKVQPDKPLTREEKTLALLAKFQNRLRSVIEVGEDDDDEITEKQRNEEKRKKEEETSLETDEEVKLGKNWMAHRLEFEGKIEQKVLDPSKFDAERYDISDPRNPINVRKRKSTEVKSKSKKSSRVS